MVAYGAIIDTQRGLTPHRRLLMKRPYSCQGEGATELLAHVGLLHSMLISAGHPHIEGDAQRERMYVEAEARMSEAN